MYWLLVEGLEASLIYIEKDSNSIYLLHIVLAVGIQILAAKKKKSYCMLCEVKKKNP